MLTKLLTPLNRLIGPDGLIPLIKASPWLLIPILAYHLANNYLNAENEINKRHQTVEELLSIAEANPEMKGPIGYYLVRIYPQDKDQNMLLNYLELVEHLSEKDSSQQQEHWQRSADLILNVRNYFGTGASYGLSRDYLKTRPVSKSLLAKQMMLESENHDHGIERFVRAFTEDSILDIKGDSLLIMLVEPYLIEKKVRRNTRDEILGIEKKKNNNSRN